MTYVCTAPVFKNKWRFYTYPLSNDKQCFNFNWFACGCPLTDKRGNRIIKVSRYNKFFDMNTGKSYYTDSDNDSCDLLIVEKSKIDDNTFKEIQKYCGFAIKTDGCYERDLVFENVKFYFNSEYIIESTSCPYIEYAKSREKYLRKLGLPGFPSVKELKNAKPGVMSLKLKKILKPYFENV